MFFFLEDLLLLINFFLVEDTCLHLDCLKFNLSYNSTCTPQPIPPPEFLFHFVITPFEKIINAIDIFWLTIWPWGLKTLKALFLLTFTPYPLQKNWDFDQKWTCLSFMTTGPDLSFPAGYRVLPLYCAWLIFSSSTCQWLNVVLYRLSRTLSQYYTAQTS